MYKKINEILNKSQNGSGNHEKNVKLLEGIYKTTSFTEFAQHYLKLLKWILVSDPSHKAVDSMVEFLGHFLGKIVTLETQEETEETEQTHSLLKIIIEELIEKNEQNTKEFSLNLCNFLAATFKHIGDHVIISEKEGSLFQNCMLDKLQDFSPKCRIRAVEALVRLQDPSIPDCAVISAFINSLGDPNYLVRQKIIQCIAPSKASIRILVEAVQDRSPVVRCAAYKRLSNLVKFIKIIHRQQIFTCGFSESDLKAKLTFNDVLIPKWLSHFNGSYIQLMKSLKLDAYELDIQKTEKICSKTMDILFKNENLEDLLNELPLDDAKLISIDVINMELAHYWWLLVKFINESENNEEYRARVVPELTQFSEYIKNFIEAKLPNSMQENWEHINIQYILYYLFEIINTYDFSEEMGRRTLDKLIKEIFQNHRVSSKLLNKLMAIFSKLYNNSNEFSSSVCEIVTNISEPLAEKTLVPAQQSKDVEFKTAELRVKIISLEADIEGLIANKNFLQAQELSDKINTYRMEMGNLNKPPEREMIKTPTMDADALCWSLEILASILSHGNLKELTPCLITCREEYLIPLMCHSNIEITKRAFKCMAIYCVFQKDIVIKYMKLICSPITTYGIIADLEKTMIIDSGNCLTDLIFQFGTGILKNHQIDESSENPDNEVGKRLYNEDNNDLMESNIDKNLTMEQLMDVFLNMFDEPILELRDFAITSIIRLLLKGIIISPAVIARIILKWFNPISNARLQQKLGYFIATYAEKVRGSKLIIAKAIVPIITQICEAPRSSPLYQVDMNKLIRFLVTITDCNSQQGIIHIHTQIARIIIQEISAKPKEMPTIHLTKLLLKLDILMGDGDSPAVKEIVANTKTLLAQEEGLEKTAKKNVEKFLEKISKKPEEEIRNSTNTSIVAARTVSSSVAATSQITNRRLSSVIEEVDSENEQEINDNSRPVVILENFINGEVELTTQKTPSVVTPQENPLIENIQQSPILTSTEDISKENVPVTPNNNSDNNSDSIIPSSQPETVPLVLQTRNSNASFVRNGVKKRKIEKNHTNNGLRRSARNRNNCTTTDVSSIDGDSNISLSSSQESEKNNCSNARVMRTNKESENRRIEGNRSKVSRLDLDQTESKSSSDNNKQVKRKKSRRLQKNNNSSKDSSHRNVEIVNALESSVLSSNSSSNSSSSSARKILTSIEDTDDSSTENLRFSTRIRKKRRSRY